MNATEIVVTLYRGLLALMDNNRIPIELRTSSVVGTVQDDPFDCWIGDVLKKVLPDSFEIVHAGKLTTPDLVIRDRTSGTIVGLEIKKLIQLPNGNDPRGNTIDYNSCLPCGKTMIKVGTNTVEIPCYYLFALLNPTSTAIISLIIMDGDFLNYDFAIHKESKYANYSEYNHGPYGEGSVRHRKMYTYPNPLNSKLSAFYLRFILVLKKIDLERIEDATAITEQIIRTDKYSNSFYYLLLDEAMQNGCNTDSLPTLTGIFDSCKIRKPKERTAAFVTLSK